MNRRAVPHLRGEGKRSPTTFNRSFMLVKPSPRPLIASLGVEAGARILDCQVDGVDLTVQRDVGVSRHAMLEDILQGFLQDAVERGRFPVAAPSGCSRSERQSSDSCRFDNSSQNPAAAFSSPKISSFAG